MKQICVDNDQIYTCLIACATIVACTLLVDHCAYAPTPSIQIILTPLSTLIFYFWLPHNHLEQRLCQNRPLRYCRPNLFLIYLEKYIFLLGPSINSGLTSLFAPHCLKVIVLLVVAGFCRTTKAGSHSQEKRVIACNYFVLAVFQGQERGVKTGDRHDNSWLIYQLRPLAALFSRKNGALWHTGFFRS